MSGSLNFTIRRSIFTKLFFIFLTSTLVITSLCLYFVNEIKYSDTTKQIIRDRNRVQYSELLADSIGFPPDFKKAKQFSEQLEIKIRIESNSGTFSSDNFDIDSRRLFEGWHGIHGRNGTYVSENARQQYVIVQKNGVTSIFEFRCEPFSEGRLELLVPLVILILLIMLGSYLSVRHLFKPLQTLTRGIREIADGNLAHRVPMQLQDEMGILAGAFNQMADRIVEMLKTKDQLLLDISHELRSPLARSKFALELPPEEYLDKIRANLNEMDTMLDELLESARLENGKQGLNIETLQLSIIIHRFISHYEGRSPGIIVHPISEDLLVRVDEARFHRVLRNLIENAMKYSAHQEKPVEILVEKRDLNEVIISIKDHGHGVPKEEQLRVFEPFYRVDKGRTKATGGYGLGLSLCKKIMQAHKGEIFLHSELGSGTTVTLKFPV